MGSPLGLLLADFFMATVEEKLRPILSKAAYYRRYVDDILIICDAKQFQEVLQAFSTAHPNLRVTHEAETCGRLPFLDVCLIKCNDGKLKTTVYRKPTWSGRYSNFYSFTPMQHKRALVRTLFSRARTICSPEYIDDELNFLKLTLMQNGYPESFIRYHSRPSNKATPLTAPKKPVFIELPFKGDNVQRMLVNRLSKAVGKCFYAANVKVLAKTRPLPIVPI